MKSLNCLIIDDESHAANLLNTYVRQTPGLEVAGVYTNPLLALEEFSDGGQAPDVTFLDIDMPELSGMDLAGLINRRTVVIFTTSFKEYAADAFETNAFDYLLKPISYERFLRCIQKIRDQRPAILPAAKDYFFIKSDMKGKLLRVSIPEIRYIESMGNYVQIFLSKEKLIAYLTLEEILGQLPPGNFSRIQKSLIVAHGHIRSVEHAQVRLLDRPEPLSVGKVYRQAFLRNIHASLVVSKRGA